eukprot:scaffold24034_cov135-Skeletonema_dohrnii-CCMP3373.AAC.3
MGASTSCSKRISSSQKGVESNEDDSMSSSRFGCFEDSAVASITSANRSRTSERSFHWTFRNRPSLYNFDVAISSLELVRFSFRVIDDGMSDISWAWMSRKWRARVFPLSSHPGAFGRVCVWRWSACFEFSWCCVRSLMQNTIRMIKETIRPMTGKYEAKS